MFSSDPVPLRTVARCAAEWSARGTRFRGSAASFSVNTRRPSRARSRPPFLWMSPWITSRNSKTGHPSRIRLRPCAGTCPWRENRFATQTSWLAHGERHLLTFNAGDFRRYGERIELVDMEDAE